MMLFIPYLAGLLSFLCFATAQTTNFAVRGNVKNQLCWVEVRGSGDEVAINFATKPNPGLATWTMQVAGTGDPNIVTIFHPQGGYATILPGNPLVCGGRSILGTSFFSTPTLWKVTDIGQGNKFISTNVTRADGTKAIVYWSMHISTGLLPLDATDQYPCSDAGYISGNFMFLDPSAAA